MVGVIVLMCIQQRGARFRELAAMSLRARGGLSGMNSTFLTPTAFQYTIDRDLPDERRLAAWRRRRDAAPRVARSFNLPRPARPPRLHPRFT
jgi:hypothetical protein